MAFKNFLTILIIGVACANAEIMTENEVATESRVIKSGDDLVSAVTEECPTGEQPFMTCIRQKVLSYMNHLLGVTDKTEGRGFSDDNLDEVIASRMGKFINTHEFKVRLPEFLFQEAILTFRPGRSLSDFEVKFPKEPENEERAISQAKGLLKKKLILPLLLLLKLKMKAITPILLLAIGIKAFKAYLMSKLSLLLVVGFLIVQLCKKAGMMMPMPAATATEPPTIYGPAPTPAPYGPPGPTPDTSYGPWEPSSSNGNGGPYARWDAHNIAYSSYQPDSTVKTAQQIKSGL